MGFDYIRSWYELEEITEKQELMIADYKIKIERLEQEIVKLKEELITLKGVDSD
jgi:phage regulator Rha-like protein